MSESYQILVNGITMVELESSKSTASKQNATIGVQGYDTDPNENTSAR